VSVCLHLCTCMSTGLCVCEFSCLNMCVYLPPCLCVSRRACVSCYSSFRVTVCPSVFCLHSRLTPPEGLRVSPAAAPRFCGLFVCLSVCLRVYISVCSGCCVFYGMSASLRLRICASVRFFLFLCTCTHVGICVGSCVCVYGVWACLCDCLSICFRKHVSGRQKQQRHAAEVALASTAMLKSRLHPQRHTMLKSRLHPQCHTNTLC